MMHDSVKASVRLVGAAIVGGVIAREFLPEYWVYLATSLLITAIVLQSLGLVVSRAGMISLCQMSFAGVGAWVVGWLNVVGAPGGLIVWTLVGGLAAVPFGVAIGLPALRLRGVNLAIVTLGFASAFGMVLATINFPGQTSFLSVARPGPFTSGRNYFVLVLGFYVIISVGLEFLARSRVGASWLALRHSERAAASHGVSVPAAKVSAFAISAFIAGISGGLLAGFLGTVVSINFSVMQSLAMFAVATMAGSFLPEGALIGGLLVVLVPQILRTVGMAQDWGNVLFAVGAAQALSTGEAISEAVRRAIRKVPWPRVSLGGVEAAAVGGALPAPLPLDGSVDALRIEALTVRYGRLVALDSVDLSVPTGEVVGLIGPNGAGKSTLIDAVSGFLTRYEGKVLVAGEEFDGRSPHLRARGGIRRTWQTTRIAPELTVGQYMRLAAGKLDEPQLLAVLDWLGCGDPRVVVSSLDAGTRRLLDVAGAVAARPAVVLLDEPAAGQSYDDAYKLGQRIARIPTLFGSAVLLVEHDMDLIRMACSLVSVLDFGSVVAAGPTRDVLDDASVKRAYLGIDEEDAA